MHIYACTHKRMYLQAHSFEPSGYTRTADMGMDWYVCAYGYESSKLNSRLLISTRLYSYSLVYLFRDTQFAFGFTYDLAKI